jgi:hypothetical protein
MLASVWEMYERIVTVIIGRQKEGGKGIPDALV